MIGILPFTNPFVCQRNEPTLNQWNTNLKSVLLLISFVEADEQISNVLEHYAKLHPSHEESLLSKARYQEQKRAVIKDRAEFMRLIDAVDEVLDEIERHLKANDGNKNQLDI